MEYCREWGSTEHYGRWEAHSTLEDEGAKSTVENGGNAALWRSWGHRALLKVEVTLQRESYRIYRPRLRSTKDSSPPHRAWKMNPSWYTLDVPGLPMSWKHGRNVQGKGGR